MAAREAPTGSGVVTTLGGAGGAPSSAAAAASVAPPPVPERRLPSDPEGGTGAKGLCETCGRPRLGGRPDAYHTAVPRVVGVDGLAAAFARAHLLVVTLKRLVPRTGFRDTVELQMCDQATVGEFRKRIAAVMRAWRHTRLSRDKPNFSHCVARVRLADMDERRLRIALETASDEEERHRRDGGELAVLQAQRARRLFLFDDTPLLREDPRVLFAEVGGRRDPFATVVVSEDDGDVGDAAGALKAALAASSSAVPRQEPRAPLKLEYQRAPEWKGLRYITSPFFVGCCGDDARVLGLLLGRLNKRDGWLEVEAIHVPLQHGLVSHLILPKVDAAVEEAELDPRTGETLIDRRVIDVGAELLTITSHLGLDVIGCVFYRPDDELRNLYNFDDAGNIVKGELRHEDGTTTSSITGLSAPEVFLAAKLRLQHRARNFAVVTASKRFGIESFALSEQCAVLMEAGLLSRPPAMDRQAWTHTLHCDRELQYTNAGGVAVETHDPDASFFVTPSAIALWKGHMGTNFNWEVHRVARVSDGHLREEFFTNPTDSDLPFERRIADLSFLLHLQRFPRPRSGSPVICQADVLQLCDEIRDFWAAESTTAADGALRRLHSWRTELEAYGGLGFRCPLCAMQGKVTGHQGVKPLVEHIVTRGERYGHRKIEREGPSICPLCVHKHTRHDARVVVRPNLMKHISSEHPEGGYSAPTIGGAGYTGTGAQLPRTPTRTRGPWNCPACTYANEGGSRCTVCSSARP